MNCKSLTQCKQVVCSADSADLVQWRSFGYYYATLEAFELTPHEGCLFQILLIFQNCEY